MYRACCWIQRSGNGFVRITVMRCFKERKLRMSQRFTSKVRRGFAQLIQRNLERNVERAIENGTAPNLKRSERLTAVEVAELRAAVVWIKEQSETPNESDASESENNPT
jgi:hypothetical protein